MLETELTPANATREKANAKKKIASELQKDAESRFNRLRKKYHHYKAKAKRYVKQLILVLWLHDLSWSRGYNWGFENYRTLVLNPQTFSFDLAIVSPFTLGITDEAIIELEQIQWIISRILEIGVKMLLSTQRLISLLCP